MLIAEVFFPLFGLRLDVEHFVGSVYICMSLKGAITVIRMICRLICMHFEIYRAGGRKYTNVRLCL